jgi:excisionase family DNA binding protein
MIPPGRAGERFAQQKRAENLKPRTSEGHGVMAVGDDKSQEAGVQRLLLTPEQAAETLAIGRTSLYGLLSTGALPSVHIGGSRRIPYQAIRSFVEDLQANPSRMSEQHPPSDRRDRSTRSTNPRRRRPSPSPAPGRRVTEVALRLPLDVGDSKPS